MVKFLLKSLQSLFLGSFLILAIAGLNSVNAEDRYSVATGNWNTTATWSATSGGSAGASVPVAGDNVSIEGGYTVTVNANTGALTLLSIASGSQLTTTSAFTVSATTITVNGTYVNGSTGIITGTMTVNGTYKHNFTAVAGTIPTATWATGSTCEIIGYTTANNIVMVGMNQSFYHFTWNNPSQKGDISGLGTPGTTMNINGNFSFLSSGTGNKEFKLIDCSTCTVNIQGDLIFNATAKTNKFDLSKSGTGSTINIYGDWKHSSGTLKANSAVNVVFKKSGTQIFDRDNTNTNALDDNTVNINFIVNSGATLQMAAATVVSGTAFTLASGATLGITSPDGITAAVGTATGNIRTTTTRSFSTEANYIYNGTADQNTGTGLPATVSNLTFNNSGKTVTFNTARIITNNFSITSGTKANLAAGLSHTAGTLTLGGSGTAAGSWGSTSSSATHEKDTYFAATTGIVNVSVGSCTNPSVPGVTPANNTYTYDGQAKTAIATVGTGEIIDWYTASTGNTATVAPTGTNFGTYSAYAEARNTTTDCVSASRSEVILTIGKADAVIVVNPYDVTYDANPHTSTFTAVGVETIPVDLTGLMDVSGTTQTDAGTYNSAAWSFAGNTNYASTSGTVDNNIDQATAVITVTPYSVTYDGIAHTSTFTAVGIETIPVDLTGLMDVSGTTQTDVGTYNSAAWSFPGNTNYASTSGTVDNNIDQATAVITVTPYSVTYDGIAHTSTFTAVGVETIPVDLTGLMDVSGTTQTDAGTYNSAAWSFAGNTNYASTSGTVDNNIDQATAVITVTPYSVTYDGIAHTSTFTAVGVETIPVDLTGLMDVSGTTQTDAGTYNSAAWSFAGNTNYASTSGTVDNNIDQATAVITVTPYSVTYDGIAHTSTFTAVGVETIPVDLTGLMDVSGTTQTDAGTYNSAAWSFAGNTNYASTSGTVDNNIDQATAVITVTPYSVTYDGIAHTSTFTAVGVETIPVDLTGLMDVSGTTQTDAGTYNSAAWSFAGNTNYASTSGTVDNNIDQATAVITVTPYSVTYDGIAHTSTFTAVGVETIPVDLTGLMDVSGTTQTDVGTYNSAAWSFAGNTNYASTSGTVDNNIDQATAVITVTPYSVTYDGIAHTSTFTAVGVETIPVDLTGLMDVSGTTQTDAGTYNSAAWSFAGNTNYASTSGTVDNNIDQAASTTVVTVSNAAYDGSPHGGSAQVTGDGGLNESVTVYYEGIESTDYESSTTAPTNAGTYSATATYAGDVNYLGSEDSKDFTIGSKAASTTVVTVSDATYDGLPHGGTAQVTGEGLNESVTVYYEGIESTTYSSSTTAPINAGTYSATATYAESDNYLGSTESKNFTIDKAVITGISLRDKSFKFNGKEKSLEIDGTLPAGTTVSYSNNGRTDEGTQVVTATISGTNYQTLVLTANLTINPAKISGIKFDNASFEYDGTEKVLEIKGTLPAGTGVVYTNDKRTEIGIQEATATISGPNYQTLILTATLEIKEPKKGKKPKANRNEAQKVIELDPKEGSGNVESANEQLQSIESASEIRFGDFKMFPNPAESEVTIGVELDQSATVGIRIYDAIGRLVYQEEGIQSGRPSYRININHLSAGLYMVQVKTGQIMMMKRLIKK